MTTTSLDDYTDRPAHAGPTVFDLPGFSPALVDSLTGVFEQGEGSTFQNAPAEIELQSRFLIGALREAKARTVLETGTHNAHFCYLARLAAPEATIDTFGIDPGSEAAVDLLNAQLGPFVRFHPGDSRRTLPAFAPDHPIDFAWVDGGHDRATCGSDLSQCDRLGVPHVCVDDYRGERGVREAVERFVAETSYEVVAVSQDRRGIAWLRRKTERREERAGSERLEHGV